MKISQILMEKIKSDKLEMYCNFILWGDERTQIFTETNKLQDSKLSIMRSFNCF